MSKNRNRDAAYEELFEAFEKWAAEHGVIWFDNDVRLAEAIAKVLDIDLVWDSKVRVAG